MVLLGIKTSQTGFEATREIKAAFPEVRIFIVSQWDSPVCARRPGSPEPKTTLAKWTCFGFENSSKQVDRSRREDTSPRTAAPGILLPFEGGHDETQ